MSFNIGDYVVYGGYEIWRIEEKVKRCFDGTTPREYYKLIPVYSKGSTYYIPSDDYEEKIRRFKDCLHALNDPELSAAEKNRFLKSCVDKILYYNNMESKAGIGRYIENVFSLEIQYK